MKQCRGNDSDTPEMTMRPCEKKEDTGWPGPGGSLRDELSLEKHIFTKLSTREWGIGSVT